MEKGRLEEHARGFGMQLADLLALQISGETTLSAREGTIFTLTAPLPESTITAG